MNLQQQQQQKNSNHQHDNDDGVEIRETKQLESVVPLCSSDDNNINIVDNDLQRRARGNQLGYCYDLVLENMPIKQRMPAKTALKILLENKRFSYDAKSGQISIDGKCLPNSNLTELISICTRIYPPFVTAKSIDFDLLPGLDAFVQLLSSTSLSAQIVCCHPQLKCLYHKYRAKANRKLSNNWVEI